jgi:hypothetical protein
MACSYIDIPTKTKSTLLETTTLRPKNSRIEHALLLVFKNNR